MNEQDCLRRQAEEIVRESPAQPSNDSQPSLSEEHRRTLHELRVHQVELEMQNEALRATQLQLCTERMRYFDLFNLAPVGYCTLSDRGLILEVNLTFASMLDTVRSELLDQPFNHCIHKESQDLNYLLHKKLLETGEPQVCELQMMKKDGTPFWAHMAATAAKDPEGLRAFRIVLSDITERKQMEDKLRQTQKMEAVGQLAGGVAHDFNNIIAATMMQLSLLQMNTSLDPEARNMVNELMVDAKRAASIARQLLLFSRKSIREFKILDLNAVVINLLNMLERLIGEQTIVRFDHPASLPPVEADSQMVEQVVMNLVLNAHDAMPKGGLLTISLESIPVDAQRLGSQSEIQPGQFVCLSVCDTGCGMDEGILKHIFEPFFTTKEVGMGTGLGLAVVHGIMVQHKGWVDVESRIGKGTTFRVYFPVSIRGTVEPGSAVKPEVLYGHETILLVEDDPVLRNLAAKAMRTLGYPVHEADNGQSAMKLWEEHGQQIDLLFSDMMMPGGITGFDLAVNLRKTKSSLKVIISSGYNVDIPLQGSHTSEGFVYFQKPYEVEALSRTLRDCLDGS